MFKLLHFGNEFIGFCFALAPYDCETQTIIFFFPIGIASLDASPIPVEDNEAQMIIVQKCVFK